MEFRPGHPPRQNLELAIYEVDKCVCLIGTIVGGLAGDVGPDLREIVQGARAHDNGGHLLR